VIQLSLWRSLPPFAFVAAFAGANLLALGGAVWLLSGRGHHSDWAISLLFSTGATVGGAVLLGELSVSFIASLAISSVRVLPPSAWTAWFVLIWSLLVGPTLLVTAILLRAKATPLRVYLLQAVQILTWAFSGLALLALTVQA
jgi:hypothetical protein